jgi:hypothetical protein
MHRHIAVAALALVSVSVSACGGKGGSDAKNEEAKFQEAALKHARCMRENGIDFPDPTFAEGRGSVRLPEGANRQKMHRAQEKCKHFIDDAMPEITPEERDQVAEQALAHARCMRAQGIDVSDPVVDSKGRVRMRVSAGGDKPSGARLDRAEEKCQKAGGGDMKFPRKGR